MEEHYVFCTLFFPNIFHIKQSVSFFFSSTFKHSKAVANPAVFKITGQRSLKRSLGIILNGAEEMLHKKERILMEGSRLVNVIRFFFFYFTELI